MPDSGNVPAPRARSAPGLPAAPVPPSTDRKIAAVRSSIVDEIRGSLAASRRQADGILARASEEAKTLEAAGELEARRRGQERLAEIERLRASIDDHAGAIESAYVAMVESLAATSSRLLQLAREADFSPPEWPGGIPHTVELKLRETREMTVTLRRGRDGGAA